MIQEKQSTYQRIKYTSSWFLRSQLSYSVLAIFHCPMRGLSMETKMLVLAKHIIYCSEIPFHDCYSINFWIDVLGPWFKNVSYKIQGNKRNKFKLISHLV